MMVDSMSGIANESGMVTNSAISKSSMTNSAVGGDWGSNGVVCDYWSVGNSVMCDGDGCTASDLKLFKYERIKRPLYPFDMDMRLGRND